MIPEGAHGAERIDAWESRAMNANGGGAWTCRSVGVVGSGPMGLSLAGMLGREVPVAVVARRESVRDAIRAQGVGITGAVEAASRPTVVARIADLGGIADLSAIFVATKTASIDDVAAELAPVLRGFGPGCASPLVVSFQNGIEPGRRLIERLRSPRVLRMVLNYSARSDDDGTVRIMHNRPPHFIGSLFPDHRAACRLLAGVLTRCGLETRMVESIEPYVWMKGLVNAAVNPVAALVNATVGEVLDSPSHGIVSRLLDEGLAVARAEGIDLGSDARGSLWAAIESARPHVPSMVSDIRSGRPSEVGQLNRQVIAHAARAGVPVASHELITALIDTFDWRVFHRNG